MAEKNRRGVIAALVTCMVLAGCGGGGGTKAVQPVPPAPASATTAAPAAVTRATMTLGTARAPLALSLGAGVSVEMGLHTSGAGAGRAIGVETVESVASSGTRKTQSLAACPVISPIKLANPFSFPITIRIDDFAVRLPCSVNGLLLGVSFYQVKPQPAVISSLKLGDLSGAYNKLTFTPTATSFTLPPNTVSAIAILMETSTSEVGVPVAPGAQTNLTSNSTGVPTTLGLSYTTASGGSAYSVGCFNAFVNGVLDPRLTGLLPVGRPSFFCVLDPGQASISFGGSVGFTIGAPIPDQSILSLDGPQIQFACGATTTSGTPCSTAPFTIANGGTTTYKNAIVGNVDDLRACVPVSQNTDCNALSSPAPAATSVSLSAGEFQFLVADDPTYHAGAGLPWDGLFRTTASGACRLSTGPDNNNGDVPPSPIPGQPGYSDADQAGVGPFAEYDIAPTAVGTCTITVAEDPLYIADYTNPAMPTGRTITRTIAVTP